MKRKYDWMAEGKDYPISDSILKFFGLARYSVVKALENDIKLIANSESYMWKMLNKPMFK